MKEKSIKALEIIEQDMENAAKKLDGWPYNGKILVEYLITQVAAISTLTRIVKFELRSQDKKDEKFEYVQILHDRLTSLVKCIEIIKHKRQHDYTGPNWLDWHHITKELVKAKRVL